MGMGMKVMKVAVTNPLCVFMWSNAGPQFNSQNVSFPWGISLKL